MERLVWQVFLLSALVEQIFMLCLVNIHQTIWAQVAVSVGAPWATVSRLKSPLMKIGVGRCPWMQRLNSTRD